MKHQGRVAYEAYAQRWGQALAWDALMQEEQDAWHAAAESAIREFWGRDESCPETVRAYQGYPEGVL